MGRSISWTDLAISSICKPVWVFSRRLAFLGKWFSAQVWTCEGLGSWRASSYFLSVSGTPVTCFTKSCTLMFLDVSLHSWSEHSIHSIRSSHPPAVRPAKAVRLHLLMETPQPNAGHGRWAVGTKFSWAWDYVHYVIRSQLLILRKFILTNSFWGSEMTASQTCFMFVDAAPSLSALGGSSAGGGLRMGHCWVSDAAWAWLRVSICFDQTSWDGTSLPLGHCSNARDGAHDGETRLKKRGNMRQQDWWTARLEISMSAQTSLARLNSCGCTPPEQVSGTSALDEHAQSQNPP